jgi:hypothetical protein
MMPREAMDSPSHLSMLIFFFEVEAEENSTKKGAKLKIKQALVTDTC